MADPHLEMVHRFLDGNWNEEAGYTAPNPTVYPWRFLWDSCFHVVLWSRLRPDRALRELRAALTPQDETTGFIPHMHYVTDPGYDRTLWGRDTVSIITQPPMYGHAVRVMSESGLEVPEPLIQAARRGIGFFLEHRLNRGLVTAVHPWETGCDDSPRWDSWVHDPYTRHSFALIKGQLVAALELMGDGVAIDSSEFQVGSVALTALVAFNALELASVTGDSALVTAGSELADALERRWDDNSAVWVDGGPDPRPSGSTPTLEGYFPLLVDDHHWEQVRAIIEDPDRFAAPYGPRQVDRNHHAYRSDGYWRGSSWAPLNYLLWVAACRHGDVEWAAQLAETTLAGAEASGWAEYWDPDTGAGQGASPQSWTGLAALMMECQNSSG